LTSRTENNIGSGYTFGENHDKWVGVLTQNGVPDILANIPSMPVAYVYSVYMDFSELPIDQRPEFIPILEVKHDICGN
jgi:hypothetical protein